MTTNAQYCASCGAYLNGQALQANGRPVCTGCFNRLSGPGNRQTAARSAMQAPPPPQPPAYAPAYPALHPQGYPPPVYYQPPAPMVVVQQVTQVVGYMPPPPYKRWSPGVAAVLSFFFPGVGQMYKGQVFNGLAWLVLVLVGYAFFVVPGLVLHLCCVIGAAGGDSYR